MAKNKKKHIPESSSSLKRNIIMLALILLVYYGYFIQINFFLDWDSLATAISMKNGNFNLIHSFSAYHMLVAPLVYFFTLIISPIYGWEPLMGWKILVLLSAVGTGIMLYITVYMQTKNQFNALIATMALAGTYGYLFLTLSLEDNIINSFFNMVFIFCILSQIGEINWDLALFDGKRVIPIATGISLGLAIATHIQSALLVLLIPTILYYKRKNGISSNIKEIILVATGSIAIIAPIIIINAYAGNWSSFTDFINYFSIAYHKDPSLYYFANQDRDIWRQFELVNWGLTSLLFQRYQEIYTISTNFLTYSKFLIIGFLLVFSGFAMSSFKKVTTQVMLLMLLTKIPHSLFYESWNIERWDGILLPIYIIIGSSLSSATTYENKTLARVTSIYFKHGHKIAIASIAMLFIFSITSFASLSHFQENPAFKLGNEIDKNTKNDSLVLIGIRSTSELGLYIKYSTNRDLMFISDYSPEEVLKEINLRLSDQRPVYISTIAASYLFQEYPQLKERFTYTLVIDNGYYSLYELSAL